MSRADSSPGRRAVTAARCPALAAARPPAPAAARPGLAAARRPGPAVARRPGPAAARRPGLAAARRPGPAVARRPGLAVARRLAAGGTDRGANPVELAVAMPAILLLLFASIQTAAWFVARSTALNAAQSAVNAQRLHQAPPGAGEARAARFLRAAGGWLVDWDKPAPSCESTRTEVTCTVRGRSLSVVPGVDFPVRQTAHGTVERWTTP